MAVEDKSDECTLRDTDYKPELKRNWSWFQNFCLCFSVMSIFVGIPPLYGTALVTGGPIMAVRRLKDMLEILPVRRYSGRTKVAAEYCYRSITESIIAHLISVHKSVDPNQSKSHSQLVLAGRYHLWLGIRHMHVACRGSVIGRNAYPKSGGVYYWTAALCRPKYVPIVSFFTGWFNLIGYLAGLASASFGMALLTSATATLATDGEWTATPGVIVGIYISVLFTQGLINTYANGTISLMMVVSMYWHMAGTLIIILSLLICTRSTPKSAQFVFTDFENHTGWANGGFVVLLGLLQSQFSMTGYDSAAHMTEETQNPERAGPISILSALIATSTVGLVFLLAVTFSIQDYDRVISSKSIPIAQVFLDALGKRGAVICMCIILGGVFFCGNSLVTSTSRLIYTLSRDGALPFSATLHRLDPKTKAPVFAVWGLLFVTALLGLLYLGSATGFLAITSICTIALNITYALPTACLILTRDDFVAGPFSLGKWSRWNGIISILWISFISVLFLLPTQYPVTASNMNYAFVVFLLLWIVIGVYWCARGRFIFKGPIHDADSFAKSAHTAESEDEEKATEFSRSSTYLGSERLAVASA